MRAIVVNNQTADPDYALDEQVGDEIDVVGWATRNGQTIAIYRDDAGFVHDIPSWAIRLVPYVEVTTLGGTVTFGTGRLADTTFIHPSAEQASRTVQPQPPDWRPRA